MLIYAIIYGTSLFVLQKHLTMTYKAQRKGLKRF
jgi:hypothetical protein